MSESFETRKLKYVEVGENTLNLKFKMLSFKICKASID